MSTSYCFFFLLIYSYLTDIGGLACAYTLAAAGHHVRVLERLRKEDPTSWSGVRIPPNLSKILADWGLGEELKEKTLPCYRVLFCERECISFAQRAQERDDYFGRSFFMSGNLINIIDRTRCDTSTINQHIDY
jgi:2-polyprenyl-6-methoxyphenol hydroxylase-like FAD-dependent oxidoreductase